MERKYVAFISYKHAPRDSAIAKRVHTLIENYIIPKSLRQGSRKLGIVFRDEEELPISSDLTDSICKALDNSRYLIVICSREAKKSPWVTREIDYFLQHHEARDAFVVLADGEPNEVFPQQLTRVFHAGTQQYHDVEPLAMDVRADSLEASLKKANASIRKLYAAMIGCSYDSLVQREKTRRMRRAAAFGAVFMLLASCFAGVLLVKNQELAKKNDQLSAAIALALERESELLVEKADAALQAGDVAEAIKYASDALYSQDVERPYFAPAERVLFHAADVLKEGEQQPLLLKVELKQQAPIEMMTYSADGSTVYTIDRYGTVNCFDSSSGELRWDRKLTESERDFNSAVDPQLWCDGENGIIACYYDDVLSGLDVSTGSICWQFELGNTVVSGFYFEAEAQILAYIAREYVAKSAEIMEAQNEYRFMAFSTRDGQLMHNIRFDSLTENAWDFSELSFGVYSDIHSSGTFAGGDRFAGTYSKKMNGIDETMLYVVDLPENTVTLYKNESFDGNRDYMKTFYTGDDRAIVLSNNTISDVTTGFFQEEICWQSFDLLTGSLLWENRAEVEQFIAADETSCMIARPRSVVLAVSDHMWVIDKASGAVTAFTTLKADLVDMYEIADGLFAFILADGYCAVGWNNQNGLFDSAYFSTMVDLPDLSEAISHNGGLIQVYFTDSTIDGFSIKSLAEGGGSVTYLSEDRCSAYVTSALPKLATPELIPVDSGDAALLNLGEFIDVNPQGKVLLGTSMLDTGAYGMAVVDTENHTMEIIPLENYLLLGDKQTYLTADGQHVLICSKYGDIQSLALDGSLSVIAEGEEILIKTVGDMNYMGTLHRSDAARLAAEGRVAIARCDGSDLTIWMEGKEEKTVPLPEGMRWLLVDGIINRAMIDMGENSLVVLCDYASQDVNEIENFVVYSLETGEWKQIPDAGRGSNERLLAFGRQSPVFAVCDADMNIRIYDGKAGMLVQCIPTGYPMVSVMKMGMLLDDQYIYIQTMDGQFLIYQTETGKRVFHTRFGEYAGRIAFTNWLDRENARLYMCADTQALCIDIRAWEQLFSAKNFKFYSAAQNEAYIFSRDFGGKGWTLKAIPIPTTSELIDMALDTLY